MTVDTAGWKFVDLEPPPKDRGYFVYSPGREKGDRIHPCHGHPPDDALLWHGARLKGDPPASF